MCLSLRGGCPSDMYDMNLHPHSPTNTDTTALQPHASTEWAYSSTVDITKPPLESWSLPLSGMLLVDKCDVFQQSPSFLITMQPLG